MDATLYTGDSSYPRSLTNTAGFKPDLVWTKARNQTYSHVLYDSVRGTGTGAALFSDLTAAEGSNSGNVNLTSFNSNGWSVGSTSSTNILNNSAITFVGWQWQAGQGTTSSNTSGSITSTVSVNTTAGFSIVTYTTPSSFTNATVGHGLGVAPAMIISFLRNASGDTHFTWHKSLSSTQYLQLQTTAAATTNSVVYNGTSSTTFTLGSNAGWGSGNYVSYCWAEIAGFSKFGSYTANASTDGPFIYTGFRPKYILIKGSVAGNNWVTLDTSRSTYNQVAAYLLPNVSNAEGTAGDYIDILSNGFKIRDSGSDVNYSSGATYIYMAFAENPFKNALAR